MATAISRDLRWSSGILIGLLGAGTGVGFLLLGGLLSGRGVGMVTAGGAGMLPQSLSADTDLSPVAAYLIIHTAMYMVAGLVAVMLVRVADRFPPVTAGLVYVVLAVEFAFLFFSTVMLAQHRIDEVTWCAFLVAHGAADLVFLLFLILAFPNLRRDWRESERYEG